MMNNAGVDRPIADHSHRAAALATAVGLLLMALLTPFAHFGVLQNLVVPADATATVGNIVASMSLFRAAIAAFLVVAMLDVVVAWGLYIVLKPADEHLALLVTWLRVVYAAVFAYAVVNLFDVAQLVTRADATALQSGQLNGVITSSLASFTNGWDLALAIFGLHLVGLGVLLFRSLAFPRFLGVLVVLAGVGYLGDSFGRILVPDYSATISIFTFVGEALLMVWLFRVAIKGASITRTTASPANARFAT